MRTQTLFAVMFSICALNGCTKTKNVGACGDGFLDPGEACDQDQSTVSNCSELGFYLQNGSVGCDSDCTLILTACSLSCGDGLIQVLYGEQCEGGELGGATCENQGLGGGTLGCNDDCRFDSSGCEVHAVCGDGTILSPFEQCEDDDLDGQTCQSLGWYDGMLACGLDCRYDLASCRSFGKCGDGSIQAIFSEQCEGTQLGDATCESLGQYPGTLRCKLDCTFDLGECGGSCGDDLVQASGGELCDGMDLDGQTCESHGQYPGLLACASDCGAFVLDGCGGYCGDLVIQSTQGESCDGSNLGEVTCLDFNRFFGAPGCDATCTGVAGNCRIMEAWGSNGQEVGRSVATDAAGHLYVAGTTGAALDGQTPIGLDDAFLTKYGSDGTRLWTRQWGSTQEDQAFDVMVDADGSVFVTGHTRGAFDGQSHVGRTDVFLSKFTPDGTRLWTRFWGSSTYDYGLRVAAGGTGVLYLAGHSDGTMPGATNAGNFDYFLIKVNATDGSQLWLRQAGNNMDNTLGGMTPVSDGVLLTGTTFGGLDGQIPFPGNLTSDVFLVKYDDAGNRLWTQVWGSALIDSGTAVHSDASGHAFVTGRTMDAMDGNVALGSDDFFLTRFDADGTRQWTRQWGTPQADQANHVRVLPSGVILVAGACYGILPGQASFGGADIALSSFDATGTPLGAIQSGTTTDDIPYGIGVDPAGHVFVTGVTSNAVGGSTGQDVFLLFLPQ